MAVAPRKPAINCFVLSIQDPGLGMKLTACGKMSRKKYGNAKPKDIEVKISKISRISALRAKEIATPTKGAEHGVARRTAKIPEKKLGIKILFFFSS